MTKLLVYLFSLIRFVTPLICIAILLATLFTYKPMEYDGVAYPNWANAAGWAVSFTSVVCIPLAAAVKVARTPGTLRQRLDALMRPTDRWGPRRAEHRRMAEKRWIETGYMNDGRKMSTPGTYRI